MISSIADMDWLDEGPAAPSDLDDASDAEQPVFAGLTAADLEEYLPEFLGC